MLVVNNNLKFESCFCGQVNCYIIIQSVRQDTTTPLFARSKRLGSCRDFYLSAKREDIDVIQFYCYFSLIFIICTLIYI